MSVDWTMAEPANHCTLQRRQGSIASSRLSSSYFRHYFGQESRYGRTSQWSWQHSPRRGLPQSPPGMVVGLAGEIPSSHASIPSTADNRRGFERSNAIKPDLHAIDAYRPAAHAMERSGPRVVPQRLVGDSLSPVQTLRYEIWQSFQRDRSCRSQDTQSLFRHC